jgi:hypothetical protein
VSAGNESNRFTVKAGKEIVRLKSQITSTKFQTNPKFQIPISKRKPLARNSIRLGHWVIGIWCLFGIWNLGFGI